MYPMVDIAINISNVIKIQLVFHWLFSADIIFVLSIHRSSHHREGYSPKENKISTAFFVYSRRLKSD